MLAAVHSKAQSRRVLFYLSSIIGVYEGTLWTRQFSTGCIHKNGALHLVYTGQYDLGFSGLRDTHLPGAVTQPFAPRPSAFGEDERFTWRRVSRPFVFEDDTKMTQISSSFSFLSNIP
jgi:hypothetical protein